MKEVFARFSAEEALALRIFIHEVELDQNRNLDVATLFVYGPGRAMLKFFRQQDAIDPDIIQDMFGQYQPINGFRNRQDSTDPETVLRVKWEQRVWFYAREHYADLRHIIDWLFVSARGQHAWLDVVDDRGRPKKLMKCGDIERLVTEANKFVQRRHASSPAAVALTAADEEHVLDLGAGYTVIRLLSTAALDAEGKAMRHCLWLGAYESKLVDGEHEYFSVRDPHGKRVGTVETRNGLMLQFQAKFNVAPDQALLDLVDQSRVELGWKTWEEAEAEEAPAPGRRP